MKRTNRRLWLCAVLLAGNLLFIWGNSLLPGSVSGAISGWVRDVLASLFPGGPSDSESGHGLVRKLAHFAEFACLGGLLVWLLAMLKRPVGLALLCGCCAACVDETIQVFVPDRGPSVKDVLIDTFGVLTGMILLLIGYAICKKRAKHVLEDI